MPLPLPLPLSLLLLALALPPPGASAAPVVHRGWICRGPLPADNTTVPPPLASRPVPAAASLAACFEAVLREPLAYAGVWDGAACEALGASGPSPPDAFAVDVLDCEPTTAGAATLDVHGTRGSAPWYPVGEAPRPAVPDLLPAAPAPPPAACPADPTAAWRCAPLPTSIALRTEGRAGCAAAAYAAGAPAFGWIRNATAASACVPLAGPLLDAAARASRPCGAAGAAPPPASVLPWELGDAEIVPVRGAGCAGDPGPLPAFAATGRRPPRGGALAPGDRVEWAGAADARGAPCAWDLRLRVPEGLEVEAAAGAGGSTARARVGPGAWRLVATRDADGLVAARAEPDPAADPALAVPAAWWPPGCASAPAAACPAARGWLASLGAARASVASPAGADLALLPSNRTAAAYGAAALDAAPGDTHAEWRGGGPGGCVSLASAGVPRVAPAAAWAHEDGLGRRALGGGAAAAAAATFRANATGAYVELEFDPPAVVLRYRVRAAPGARGWFLRARDARPGGASAAGPAGACPPADLALDGPGAGSAPIARARILLDDPRGPGGAAVAVEVEGFAPAPAPAGPVGGEAGPATLGPDPGPARLALEVSGPAWAASASAELAAASFLAAAPPGGGNGTAWELPEEPAPAASPSRVAAARLASCHVRLARAAAPDAAACFAAALDDGAALAASWSDAGGCCLSRASALLEYDDGAGAAALAIVGGGNRGARYAGPGGGARCGEAPPAVGLVRALRPRGAPGAAAAGWIDAASGREVAGRALPHAGPAGGPPVYAAGAWRAPRALADAPGGARRMGGAWEPVPCGGAAAAGPRALLQSPDAAPDDTGSIPAAYAHASLSPAAGDEATGNATSASECAARMLARPRAFAATFAPAGAGPGPCEVHSELAGPPWSARPRARLVAARGRILLDRYGTLARDPSGPAALPSPAPEAVRAAAPTPAGDCSDSGFVRHARVEWGPTAPRAGPVLRPAAGLADCLRFAIANRLPYVALALEGGDAAAGLPAGGTLACLALAAPGPEAPAPRIAGYAPGVSRAAPAGAAWPPMGSGNGTWLALPVFDARRFGRTGAANAPEPCFPSSIVSPAGAPPPGSAARAPWALRGRREAPGAAAPARVLSVGTPDDCAAALDSDASAALARWSVADGECLFLAADALPDEAVAASDEHALFGVRAPPAGAVARAPAGPAAPPEFPCSYAGYAGCFALERDARSGAGPLAEPVQRVGSYRECLERARNASAALFALADAPAAAAGDGGPPLECHLVVSPAHWGSLPARRLDESLCPATLPGPIPGAPLASGAAGATLLRGPYPSRASALYVARGDLSWCGTCPGAGPSACRAAGAFTRPLARPVAGGAGLLYRAGADRCAYGTPCPEGGAWECAPSGACAPLGGGWAPGPEEGGGPAAAAAAAAGNVFAEVSDGVFSAVRCLHRPPGAREDRVAVCADPINARARMGCDPVRGCVAVALAPAGGLDFAFRGGLPPLPTLRRALGPEAAEIVATGRGEEVPCALRAPADPDAAVPARCATWCIELRGPGEDPRALPGAPFAVNRTCDLRGGRAWRCEGGCAPMPPPLPGAPAPLADYALDVGALEPPPPEAPALEEIPGAAASEPTWDALGWRREEAPAECGRPVPGAAAVATYAACSAAGGLLALPCEPHPLFPSACGPGGACVLDRTPARRLHRGSCPYAPPPPPDAGPAPACPVRDAIGGAWLRATCRAGEACLPGAGCAPAAGPANASDAAGPGERFATVRGATTALACALEACPDPARGYVYGCLAGRCAAVRPFDGPLPDARCDLCGCGDPLPSVSDPSCAVEGEELAVLWVGGAGAATLFEVAAWAGLAAPAVARLNGTRFALYGSAARPAVRAAEAAVASAWAAGRPAALAQPAPALHPDLVPGPAPPRPPVEAAVAASGVDAALIGGIAGGGGALLAAALAYLAYRRWIAAPRPRAAAKAPDAAARSAARARHRIV